MSEFSGIPPKWTRDDVRALLDHGLEKPCTYIIRPDGSNYEVIKGGTSTDAGKIVYGPQKALNCLQWAHDNASGGDVIYIKAPFYADGQFVISKSHISIISDVRVFYDYTIGYTESVWVRQIQIDASSSKICAIKLEGIGTRELHLYANGNAIENVDFVEGAIYSDDTYHGVIFEGDGTLNGWMDHIVFWSCIFRCSATGTTWGTINWVHCLGQTWHIFDKCVFNCYGSTSRMLFHVAEDGKVDYLYIDTPRIYNESPLTIIQIDTRNADYGIGISHMSWTAGAVEGHHDYTILKADASAGDVYMDGVIADAQFIAASGRTSTIMNMPNNFWYNGKQMVDFHDNTFCGAGTWTLGTPVKSNRIDLLLHNNKGLNPIGLIATPFEHGGATRLVIHPDGSSASPIASTEYEVQACDIIIDSTDSGNSDCSITIKDAPAGNNIVTGLSTLSQRIVFRGQTINWGAYTGVAPTVSVWFT